MPSKEQETSVNVSTVETTQTIESDVNATQQPPRRVGRPKKKDIAAKKPGKRPVGRPPGDKAIMDDYKARMLNSPKSRKVMTKILDAALDDDHKHQAVAWKIVAERILPTSLFEKAAGGAGRRAISVTISDVNGGNATVSIDEGNDDDYDDTEEPIEVEAERIDE